MFAVRLRLFLIYYGGYEKKRKIPDNMPRLDFMPEPVTLPQWNAGNIINIVAKGRKNLSAEELEIIAAVVLLVKSNL